MVWSWFEDDCGDSGCARMTAVWGWLYSNGEFALEEESRVLLAGLQWHQQHFIQQDVVVGYDGGQLDRFVFHRPRGGVGWLWKAGGGDPKGVTARRQVVDLEGTVVFNLDESGNILAWWSSAVSTLPLSCWRKCHQNESGGTRSCRSIYLCGAYF
jgi:hypothetical protein